MNLNKTFILGNLTRDPELRQTQGGQAVCSFAVATNRFYKDSSGQRQQQAEFHNIVAWGRQAEIIHQYLKKGSILLVEGRLQTRSWQDAQGVKHWRTEVIAENIQLGPRPMGGGGMGTSQPIGGADTSARHGDEQQSPPAAEQKMPDTPLPTIELSEDGDEIDIKDIPF